MIFRSLFSMLMIFPISAGAYAAGAPGQICHDAVTVPLQREGTGHVSVTLTIDGIPARMLVDTGANTNTLDIAEGQKLKPSVMPYQGARPGWGLASMSVAVGTVVFGLQQFSVMDLNFINIPSKRHGTEPFLGQLGAKFFTDFGARIDFDKMIIVSSLLRVSIKGRRGQYPQATRAEAEHAN